MGLASQLYGLCSPSQKRWSTGLADTSTILVNGDITADVVVDETSDGVYWVDIKLPLVFFEGLDRLQVLGLDIDVSVE